MVSQSNPEAAKQILPPPCITDGFKVLMQSAAFSLLAYCWSNTPGEGNNGDKRSPYVQELPDGSLVEPIFFSNPFQSAEL